MLSDVAESQTVASSVLWSFNQFAADVAAGNLPEFSFIIPDVDHNAHNGTPQQADAWLGARVVDVLSSDPDFQKSGDGVLIVDFDEAATTDDTYGGGHVAPVFWGPLVKAGYRQNSMTIYQHESMLATVMDLLSLPSPPGAAADAPTMGEFFTSQ